MSFPLTRKYRVYTPVVNTTADQTTIVDSAVEAETVSSVLFIPSASVTGVATNNRQFTLYNRGTGAGTVVVAQLVMVSGTNMTDNIPKAITLSTTSANLLLAANDVLEWESLHNNTGIADPGGLVQVNTTRVTP